MAEEIEAPFRTDVMCYVKELRYDFSQRSGVLMLEEYSCTDMTGCIKLFLKIDPEVRDILTVAGKRKDTRYARGGDGWVALEPEKNGTWTVMTLEPFHVQA